LAFAGVTLTLGGDIRDTLTSELLYRCNCWLQSSQDVLVFFLGGFLASRFGAFLFAMLKVYAIGQAVQEPWIKLTTTRESPGLAGFRSFRLQ